MTREEMEVLGWDACDVILVTGDAYVDHPSFGMAIIGRFLEAQGFRVGIISQPDWRSAEAFRALGRPRLYFGITAGNMDSMVNRYTAERKIRSDDAYTPGGMAGRRPDRAVLVYSQRAREAYPGTTIVIGSIEASLRRVAHYDYWSDTVRRSVLPDSKADILLYGNAERALAELTHRLAAGEKVEDIRDLRGTAFMVPRGWKPADDWLEVDSTRIDTPGKVEQHKNPYVSDQDSAPCSADEEKPAGEKVINLPNRADKIAARLKQNAQTTVRLPAFEAVKDDPVLYAHASRVMHLESNPGNARALVQAHADRDVWLNPPPLPLSMEEMDGVYGLPFARAPHPSYDGLRIPAWEMIRFSVNIMRGCFGGCTFCSITEHEGRVIQSRSEPSILREIEEIRDHTEGFTGIISDLGGPSANMYRMNCRDDNVQRLCRRLSCVYPSICVNLDTDHSKLISLYRKARELPGIKRIFIGSGLRYDLAVRSPEYIRELAAHHVGGLLKIAPEHTEENVLSKMMKPGIGAYEEFRRMFERFSREAGKEQYLVPYFIAAHPGTTDEDMLNLALWLKKNNFRLDQVQTFMPTPLAIATTMYHSRKNPLQKITKDAEPVETVRKGPVRRLHKAFLRYHDPDNWQLLREWLRRNGRADLIGNAPHHLVPAWKSAPVSRHQSQKGQRDKQAATSRAGGQAKPAASPGNAKAGKFAAGSRQRKGVPTRSGRK
ncbi:YgiQ family radical SAM protein [Oxalobacter vibrioformis]|uniref:YgiQ family radical SAM protein n=2 Tax=Oxalobacter vibrioformis TaxID=933080 RepID=A0A9E9LYW3_9BURK|nr:YgiQ family radical SAM protein [Oxalobacter vibrioformis]WAW11282.1 YgiQ family radical SAM protein [Oxalobacter vibrioformis]